MMNKRAWLVGLLVLVLLLVVLPTQTALGAENPDANVSVTTKQGNNGYVMVTATAKDNHGSPLTNETVKFYVEASFIVDRRVEIGSGITDATGTTTVRYQPSWTGSHQFVAVVASGPAAGAEGTTAATLESVLPPYAPEAPPMQDFKRIAGLLVLVATALVWLLLFGILGRVIVEIGRPPRRQHALTPRAQLSPGSIADGGGHGSP